MAWRERLQQGSFRGATFEILDDDHCRIEALAGMWLWAYAEADYRAGQDYARRLDETIRRHGDPTRQRTADRMAAISACFMGDPAEARRRAEAALAEPPTRVRPPYRSTIQIDREVSMRVLLARVAWLEDTVSVDADADGLTDDAEACVSHTDPTLADTDALLDLVACFCYAESTQANFKLTRTKRRSGQSRYIPAGKWLLERFTLRRTR